MPLRQTLSSLTLAALALAAPIFSSTAHADAPSGAKNIVIVHGAFADGSGWRVVHDILFHKGYHVTVVQEPLTTLDADVAATRDAIAAQDGPVVLVGHSYGGQVITVAGADAKVKSLVYVAALQPEAGESLAKLVSTMKQPSDDVQKTAGGQLFLNPAKFAADFAGDLTKNRTDFMAVSQVPAALAAFTAPATSAAWHDKPSYAVVATDDHALNPDLERWMAKRAGSKVTEIKASHAVYISQPEAVAKVIEEAAQNAK
ncbi:alpha/beta hydrolase [Paraburkholderia jirisanensis]